jgi:dipeptidyl aminopeptidase/acylaminoacyl peptidase
MIRFSNHFISSIVICLMTILSGCQSEGHQAEFYASYLSSDEFLSLLPTGENGNIETIELIYDTGSTAYYNLTYYSDGLKVTGLLGFPKEKTDCPAIIFNRGGNLDYGLLSGWELIPFVESGYVAVGSQYRGNAGGEGVEEFGGSDVNDVLNLIGLLKSLPFVDPDRIGMVGMSRGGMQTYIALKEDSLDGIQDIKAAAVVSGIADLFLWAEERPDVLADVMIPLIGASPEESPNLYEARSATYWSEKINAPLLIQHGEDDERVSIEQAIRLTQALEDAGKTVKLITYPEEDHALSQHNKGFPEMSAWFQEYFELPDEDLSLASHSEAIQDVSAWFRENHPAP